MATYVEIALDYLIAKVTNGAILVGSLMGYDFQPEFNDLEDNQFVTKHILENMLPSTSEVVVISIVKGDSYKRVIDWAFYGYDVAYGLTPKLEVHIQYEDPDNPGAICFTKATDLTPLEFRAGNVYNGAITEVHLYAHADPASPDPNNPIANENTYLYIST